MKQTKLIDKPVTSEQPWETPSLDLLNDPSFRDSVTRYAIRYHHSEKRGRHFDVCLGNPNNPKCIDFVIQRKLTDEQIKTKTPNLPAAGYKQTIKFMGAHDVSFLIAPKRKVFNIDEGYGAGKWMVVENGDASISLTGSSFKLYLGEREYAIREVTFTNKGKPVKGWLIQPMKTNESADAAPGKHATVKKDTGMAGNEFSIKYKVAVKKHQAKLMRVKITDAFLADLEKLAKTEKVEYSGGLDFEKGQKGITGYKKVRGTHWSSPFFKRNDYEMQFHTHVAYKHDDNRASSHPSPADMCNVSLLYPGFILWQNTKGKVQWLLLRSVSTSWQTENRMESLYNEVEDVIGGNTEPMFDKAWRSALNKKGLDFEKVVPNETSVYLELDSSDKPMGTKKSNELKKPTNPMVREKEKRPFAWFVAAQGKKPIIWYELKRVKAKSEVIAMLSENYIGGLGEVYILDESTNKYYQFEVYNNKQIDGKPIKEVVMVKKYPLGDPDALELPHITHGQELHVIVFEYFDEGKRFTKELMFSAINYTAANKVADEKIPRWLANRGLPTTGWKIVSHRVF